MIQELFQGSQPSLPSLSAASLYPLPPPSTNNNKPIISSSTPSVENPRCPRCDSSNTKFCYYNNYNLTQPRHFCKTCRRYWTKGGALRNVPIGGGCRKNKTTTSSISASLTKSNAARILNTITSSERETAEGFLSGALINPASPNNDPIFWITPQSSPHFSLLREKQNPNPKPSAFPVSMKGEGFLVGTHMSLGSIIANTRSLGFITPSQTAPFDFASTTSYLRNNHQHNQGGSSGATGEAPGGGFQEMYLQRVRPSATNCYPQHNGSNILGNVASSTCVMSSSIILDSAPVALGTDSNSPWGNSVSWGDISPSGALSQAGSSSLV